MQLGQHRDMPLLAIWVVNQPLICWCTESEPGCVTTRLLDDAPGSVTAKVTASPEVAACKPRQVLGTLDTAHCQRGESPRALSN